MHASRHGAPGRPHRGSARATWQGALSHSVEAELKRFDVPMMGCELEGSTWMVKAENRRVGHWAAGSITRCHGRPSG